MGLECEHQADLSLCQEYVPRLMVLPLLRNHFPHLSVYPHMSSTSNVTGGDTLSPSCLYLKILW